MYLDILKDFLITFTNCPFLNTWEDFITTGKPITDLVVYCLF